MSKKKIWESNLRVHLILPCSSYKRLTWDKSYTPKRQQLRNSEKQVWTCSCCVKAPPWKGETTASQQGTQKLPPENYQPAIFSDSLWAHLLFQLTKMSAYKSLLLLPLVLVWPCWEPPGVGPSSLILGNITRPIAISLQIRLPGLAERVSFGWKKWESGRVFVARDLWESAIWLDWFICIFIFRS